MNTSVTAAEGWDTLTGATHDLLGPTYDTALFVLEDMVQPRTLYDLNKDVDLMALDFDNADDWSEDTWDDIALHYRGYFVCLSVSILVFVAVILGFFCTICCRCCPCCRRCPCNCTKGNKNSADFTYGGGDKGMSCIQVCCLVFFVVIIAAMLMGAVITLVANQAIRDELRYDKVYDKVEDTAEDLQNYVLEAWNETAEEIRQRYNEGQEEIMDAVYKIPEDAWAALEANTSVNAILERHVQFFSTLTETSDVVGANTASLRTEATAMEQELSDLRALLDQLLPDCAVDRGCQSLVDRLYISVDYSQVPDLSTLSTASTTAKDVTEEGYPQFDRLKNEVNDSLAAGIVAVEGTLEAGYLGLEDFIQDVRALARDLDLAGRVRDWKADKVEDGTKEDIEDGLKSSYYAIMALGIILLVVVLCYLLGLCCGVCGRGFKSDGCCNKARAPCLIMGGTYVLFFALPLVVFFSFCFLWGGGLFHTEVCRYFADPDDYMKSIDTADELVVNKTSVDLHAIRAVVTCADDVTLYNALGFDTAEDLTVSLNDTLDPDRYDIPKELQDLGMVVVQITDLSLVNELELQDVKDALSIDYNLFDAAFSGNVTDTEFTDIADALALYSNNSSDPDTFNRLLDDIRALQSNVTGMRTQQEDALVAATTLQTTAEQVSIDDMITELQIAQDQVNSYGEELISGAILNTVYNIIKKVYDIFAELINSIRFEFGYCTTFNRLAFRLLSYVCVDLLYPAEALWFGMGWFILFAVIGMFTACHVSSMFEPEDVMVQYYANTYSPEPVYIKNAYM